jgi:hypothetical protein
MCGTRIGSVFWSKLGHCRGVSACIFDAFLEGDTSVSVHCIRIWRGKS